jgi:PAS domain S-box-containing protein
MQSIISGLYSFLVGGIALSMFSAVQKITYGYPIAWDGYLLSILFGGSFGLIIGGRRLKLKHKLEKMQRRNLLLSAYRNVNQLIVKEKERNRLLQGICDNLVEQRSYFNAWIAILDEDGSLITTAEAGIGEDFLAMIKQLKNGHLPDCIKSSLTQSKIVLTKEPLSSCLHCSLSGKYSGRAGVTVQLTHKEKIFGVLTVSTSKDLADDKEEQGLLEEIAKDIGFALSSHELEEEHRQTDAYLKKSADELQERVKELNCLFNISNIVEAPGITLEEILQGTVDLIVPSWQYPEITCAQIIFEEKEFQTKNYKETIWKINSAIVVHGIKKGSLTVCYREEKPEMDEGPFLKEERDLINAIAARLGRVIERRWAEEALKESEGRFRDLFDNLLIGVSIIQNDQVVYQNSEQARLLGPLPRACLLIDVDNIHPDDVEKVKGLSQDIRSLEIRTLDTEFRFFPAGKKDRKDDMKWVHCRANLTKYRGETALLINMMDITRSKEVENILRIQDKMASLGRVAAGIAHEIRNPLSGINIYINTLEKLYDKGESLEKVKKIFRHLQSASVKIESVIRRVMDFSKPSEPKFVLTEINQPIEEAILLTEATLRKSGIKIEKELGQDLPKCYADKQMIEEVILNLINNAADAMKIVVGEKKIMITTAMIKSQIFIRIIDSGPGVSEHLQDRIFDPFYTTKQESTGIGLSLCHRIIADHGGSISAGSSKWGGAEFITKIPIDSAKDEP